MANPNPKIENLKSFKPNWNHTPTRTIRVPSELADEIMAFARELDAGNANGSKDNSITDTSELLELLTEIEELKGKGALTKAKSLATKCKKLINQ
jgi:hypothetical protein